LAAGFWETFFSAAGAASDLATTGLGGSSDKRSKMFVVADLFILQYSLWALLFQESVDVEREAAPAQQRESEKWSDKPSRAILGVRVVIFGLSLSTMQLTFICSHQCCGTTDRNTQASPASC
jgi:hypothetical protein